jgi:hypothetical protein
MAARWVEVLSPGNYPKQVPATRQSTHLDFASMSTRSDRGSLRAHVVRCAIVALLLIAAPVARASELRGTKDFADVAAAVEAAVKKYGAGHVLLAMDIDNTVMSMDHDLGSDHWFEWQKYLLENEPNSPLLVAKDFDGLLKAQGLLYEHGRMHPPQPEQPKIINQLQKQGIATILLTSRGPDFRKVTERELRRCGYDIAPTALPVPDVPQGTFFAYDPANPEADGISATEIVAYKLPDPKPVSYADGLFMTAGQHKGIMLLTLLNDSPRDIKAVVYVDDNVKHVGNVFSAAVARNLDIASFHFQGEDTRVQKFNYSDKQDVDRRWRAISGEKVVTSIIVKSPQRKVIVRRRGCRPCCFR